MSTVSKIEYRAVIKFLTKEGNTPQEIKKRLDGVYGTAGPSYTTVKEWAKRFRLGYESLEDEERPGRPADSITSENISIVEQIVLTDRRLKVKEISAMSNLSDTVVRRILHEHLGMNKVSARWVPKLLSAIQRQRRVECARSFLALCEVNPTRVLESIVTGDKTMVLYFDPLSKMESMEWRRPEEGAPLKAKVLKSKRKIMATVFWDCKGILLLDFKEPNTTINATYYSTFLTTLKQKIREKRRGMLSKGVRLLHDNAPVHTASVVQIAMKDLGFEQLDHPPYSPDIAPSDYYLFRDLKKSLRGRHFSTDEELKAAVIDFFDSKDTAYFCKGIELLISRCNKCIEIGGNYIEK
ncbi:histone-lysine N-methyltransferase SETMAR-like [Leguminivora glycinivorella]|uniref:histone-lysine N-methyltransferase SETMAR-like n=1 Tax=Leguminivora glycinivorella TaxID=1035111 RepID=UPI00200E3220|nr:histone-lysine N-methyltransferase SETMAR-like [Leguminivora glycinivorella]